METIPGGMFLSTCPPKKSCHCGGRLKARCDVTLRRRTLDEYPMEHDRKDALRMLHDRRASRAEQMAALQTSLGATRQLSANSRDRFLGVLGAEGSCIARNTDVSRDRAARLQSSKSSLPQPDAERVKGPTAAPWSRPRHNSIASSVPLPRKHLEVDPPLQRPVSEPPRLQTPGGGRNLNHLRHCLSSYPPNLRQLLQDYNKKLRVECESDPFPLPARPPPSRDFRHCRLLPLVDEAAELRRKEEEKAKKREEEEEARRKEQEELAKMMVLVHPAEDAEEIGDLFDFNSRALEPAGSEKEKTLSSLSVSSGRMDKKTKAKALKPPSIKDDKKSSSNKSAKELEPVKEEPPPPLMPDPPQATPPFHCWVDDATVSSVTPPHSEHQDGDPLADESSLHADDLAGKAKDHEDAFAGDAAGRTAPPPAKPELSTKHEAEPAPSPAPAGKGKKPPSAKAGKQKVPEVLPEPPPPEPEPEPEALEEEEPEEEEPIPVLPTTICPSSDLKAQMTETKRWLMKSSFTAASRHMAIL